MGHVTLEDTLISVRGPQTGTENVQSQYYILEISLTSKGSGLGPYYSYYYYGPDLYSGQIHCPILGEHKFLTHGLYVVHKWPRTRS